MRLAHFSDIHVTHFPLGGRFALKRVAALASYTLMGRGRHFAGSEERIARLLDDVDEQRVDHALCTGDLTGVSTESEFTRVAELFGPRLGQPERYTVLPGNHDRYVPEASGRFEQHFARLCEGAAFPFVKPLAGGVTLVGLDVSRPTSLIDSSGLAGEAQRKKLEAILTDASLKDRFVVLALHYGLLRSRGQRDRRNHGLRDDLELLALVDREDVTLDLVVHGHMHRPYVVPTRRRQAINAGSATDLHVKGCGYNVYDIDARTFTVRIERREWDEASGRYVAKPDSPLQREWRTR
jgi:3',5'-cyclic AMP phosphodiesterase CpdA